MQGRWHIAQINVARFREARGHPVNAEFEAVLDIPDQHVFDWIMGREKPPEGLRSEVLDLLLSFRYSAPT